MYTKRSIVALAASALVLTLAGCGGGSNGDQGGTGTLTIWNPQDNWRATSDYLREHLDAFEQMHPDVTVEIVDIPYGQFEARYAAGFSSGENAPDIFMGQVSYYARGLGVAQVAPDDLQDQWNENLLDVTAPAHQVDGQWYGYPVSSDLGMQLFYNVEHFEEAGLDPDVPPQTFDDLREYAGRLAQHNGDTVTRDGMAIRYSGAPMGIADKALPYIHAHGGRLYAEDESTADGYLNGPGTIAGLTYMQNLIHTDNSSSLELGAPDDTFIQGLSSMTFREGWYQAHIEANAPDLEYRIAPYPTGPEGYPQVSVLFNWSWMVNASSPNSEIAWDWIRSVSNPETDLDLAELEAYLPVWESNFGDEFVTGRADYNAVERQLEEGPGPYYGAPYSNQINTAVGEAVEAILQGADVEQTLNQAVSEIDDLLAQGRM